MASVPLKVALRDKPFRPVGEKRFSSHVGEFQVSVQNALGLSLTPSETQMQIMLGKKGRKHC